MNFILRAYRISLFLTEYLPSVILIIITTQGAYMKSMDLDYILIRYLEKYFIISWIAIEMLFWWFYCLLIVTVGLCGDIFGVVCSLAFFSIVLKLILSNVKSSVIQCISIY